MSIRGDRLDVDINGTIYVLDAEKSTLRLYSKDFALLKEVGGAGWHDTQFDNPDGIWARNGIDVFVADYGNHRIQRFDRNLNFISTLFTRDSDNPDERFGYPAGVTLSRLGDLYICDGENSRIVKVNSLSQVERTFGGFDAGKGRLEKPTAVQAGPHDNIYVLDGARVVIFDTFGNFVNELAPGLFRKPSCMVADDAGASVIDGDTLFCFDENQRPILAQSIRTLTGSPDIRVRSIAFSRGTLYLLAVDGLHAVPDPRVNHDGTLDKEQKSH